MKEENYEGITRALENMESRVKSIESDKELTTRKENRNTERFEKIESMLETLIH